MLLLERKVFQVTRVHQENPNCATEGVTMLSFIICFIVQNNLSSSFGLGWPVCFASYFSYCLLQIEGVAAELFRVKKDNQKYCLALEV